MIYALAAIIILLTATTIALAFGFGRVKRDHKQKIAELEYIIVQLTSHNREQLERLTLSDELRAKLHQARKSIDENLLAMQYDFVETLSKNNLVD